MLVLYLMVILGQGIDSPYHKLGPEMREIYEERDSLKRNIGKILIFLVIFSFVETVILHRLETMVLATTISSVGHNNT